jgi:hypothetical protein
MRRVAYSMVSSMMTSAPLQFVAVAALIRAPLEPTAACGCAMPVPGFTRRRDQDVEDDGDLIGLWPLVSLLPMTSTVYS